MRKTEYNKKQVIIYLLWTFGAAYMIQFLTASLYKNNRVAGQLVLAAMMFVINQMQLKIMQEKYQSYSDRMVCAPHPDRARSLLIFSALPEAL